MMKILINIVKWILFVFMMILGLGCAAMHAWTAMLLFLLTGVCVSPAGKELLGKINPGWKKYTGPTAAVLFAVSFGVMLGTADTAEVASNGGETGRIEEDGTMQALEYTTIDSAESAAALQEENETFGTAKETATVTETTIEETAAAAKPQLMEVHFIDVGQGDCTLVKCGGFSMLIDAGDDSKGTAIQNYLQKQGIEKLDYLILTHPDADHIGGAPVVITKFDIDTVFISNYEKDNKTYLKLIQALDDRQVSYSTPEVGDTYTLGSAEFTILAPNGTYEDPNNASIALLLQNGNNSFLFTGDAEEKAEKDIQEYNENIQADVYQVGHHGAKTSSGEAFLEEVQPEFAVISCAEGNSYGHPHAQTLNTLRSMGVKVFRTDEQGSIVAESDGTEIVWNCAPSETWQAGEPTESSTLKAETAADSGNRTAANEIPVPSATVPQTQAEEREEEQAEEQAEESAQAPQLAEEVPAQTDNVSVEVHVTKTGKKYHSAGCQYLSKSDIPISLEDAKAKGYEPCSKCNPPR